LNLLKKAANHDRHPASKSRKLNDELIAIADTAGKLPERMRLDNG